MRRADSRRARPGFALVTVLWLIVAVSVVTTGALTVMRQSMAGARNRANLAVASWRAEDCVERTRAAIAEALTAEAQSDPGNGKSWRKLDRIIDQSPYVAGLPCTVVLTPAGITLDINAADREELDQLFAYLAVAELARDSLVDAMLDWRDADGAVRARGAEQSWYEAKRRLPPRNAPFGNVAELRLVRGLESAQVLDTILGVDRGRILLDRAPLAVIAALPGMTSEAVTRIAEWRAHGQEVGELPMIASQVSPPARRALESRYAELAQRLTADPDAWIVTAAAHVGEPPVTSALEVRLVRAGTRAAVMRRRSWP